MGRSHAVFSAIRLGKMSKSKSSWYRKATRATRQDIRDVENAVQFARSSNETAGVGMCVRELESPSVEPDLECSNYETSAVEPKPESVTSHNYEVEVSNFDFHNSDQDVQNFTVECDETNHQEAPNIVQQSSSLSSNLSDWALEGNVSHKCVSQLLKILHSHHPELPCDARTLLGTVCDKTPILPMGKSHFMYFGLGSGPSDLLQVLNFNIPKLTLTFNIDGQSPFKTGKMELWPILCMVDGIHHKPIIVCAYYGRGKPESSHDFMWMFVQELENLVNNGLSYEGRSIRIRVRAFICDFPAMAFIKSTLNSNGFVGCSKCFVRGITIDKCCVYHGLNETLRTDKNFRLKEQPDHHKGDSAILKLLFIDMVKQFPIDSMHVVEKLCLVWKKGMNRFVEREVIRGRNTVKVFRKKSRRKNKMTAALIQAIDKMITAINKFMPSEFSRILQPFTDSDSWKANQCRQFILYVAPVVLKGVLDNELYNHMLLLHVASRIMSSEKLCATRLDDAEIMIKKFVSKCKYLLGVDFTTQAVHALIHLSADCREHGTLNHFSAFPFESYQGELRTLLRGYARPLEQLWKRLSEGSRCGTPHAVSQGNLVKEIANCTDTKWTSLWP